jgi:hypothetical protein
MLKDCVRKIAKLSTYHCNLCTIIYNNLGLKKDWKEFIKNFGIDGNYLYKDEFFKLGKIEATG